MHENSRLLFTKYALPLFHDGMKVLEIGPDAFPSTYQQLTAHLTPEWHTLDVYDSPRLTYPQSDPYSFPIPDEVYDVVVSGQVIEHVRTPWKWLPELARITRPGGLVITISPVSWVYHEAPIDCWRIYPEGMMALYEDAALEVIFSRWESLETPHLRHFLPGVSREWQSRKRRMMYDVLGRFGFPVERAYDTITAGRKTARGIAEGPPPTTNRSRMGAQTSAHGAGPPTDPAVTRRAAGWS